MKQLILNTIISLLFLALPAQAFAASINFYPAEHLSIQEQSFTTTIAIDTSGESINAVQGVVKIDPRLINGIQVSDTGSIVTYWVVSPSINSSASEIRFSGAVPGGYKGGSGILFSIIFKPYSGDAISKAAAVTELSAYKNDGMASSVQVSLGQFNLGGIAGQVDEGISSQLYLDGAKKDDVAPEVFSPQISRDESIEGGKWFITFATVDKQSGIDHYEIQESRTGSMDSGKWKTATSPYVLQDQGLNSFIYVIAVDRQGNERIIKVYPRNPLPWYDQYGKQLMAVSLLTAAGVFIYYRRKMTSQSKNK